METYTIDTCFYSDILKSLCQLLKVCIQNLISYFVCFFGRDQVKRFSVTLQTQKPQIFPYLINIGNTRKSNP